MIDMARLAACFDWNNTPAKEILEVFGSASDIFEAGQREAARRYPPLAGIAGRLFSSKTAEEAVRDIDWAIGHGIDILAATDEEYPQRLLQCPDAPLLLYRKGRCNFSRPRFLAIVGTRASTQYGRRYCEKIIEGLAALAVKPVIVSGMALGIDTHAHTFALRYGLETIAVMGTGFNTIYPPSNEQLAEEILQRGALVTEFSPFTPSYPLNFVRRNRIIAGLSDCTLVVESKSKGGGLITAQLAQDYNRSVFAVPGRMDDNTFRGCNQLIEDNVAAIVTGARSIIKAMDWDTADARLPLAFGETGGGGSGDSAANGDGSNGKDSIKARITAFLLGHPESDAETIAAGLGLPLADLSLPLLELEMSGAISLISGNKYSAN